MASPVRWPEGEDAKRLNDLERENATLKRLLANANAELKKFALKEIALETSSGPERRRAAVRHLERVLGVSERFACRVTGQHRFTQRHWRVPRNLRGPVKPVGVRPQALSENLISDASCSQGSLAHRVLVGSNGVCRSRVYIPLRGSKET